jgi:CDP-glucose 4,6-dehydratase
VTLDFWRDRRVFITGHTGFKGSWLCLLLHSLGARVAGYALPPPTEPSLYALARVGEVVDSTRGDIRDLGSLAAAMRAARPEVVLHLAAQSIVLRSYDDPVETYSTNVIGTVNTFEAVRQLDDPCAVVNVTTDKCYQNNGWVWGYRETDRLGGHDPYSSSKACAELIGQSYRDSFFPLSSVADHGVAIASARAGNVIGGGDWTPRQLVPEAIAAFMAARPVVLRHPNAVRPWQHVLDCLGGYLQLAEALAGDPARFSGEWNFGPADAEPRTVAAVVEALAAHWQIRQPWQQDDSAHAAEALELRLDVSKAAAALGWRSRLPIDEALRWVADWYRAHHTGTDARTLCLDQVGRYVRSVNE